MKVKFVRCRPDAIGPKYHHDGDSGFDLYSAEDCMLWPGHTIKISTGLQFEIPEGYELQVRPKSGLSLNSTIKVIFGTVDSSYRGQVCVIAMNAGMSMTRIEKGEAIAQGVICPVIRGEFEEVEDGELSETSRGANGFGSTGQ